MLLAVFVTCVLGVYLLLKWKHSYWSKRGIAQVKPDFLFGNFKDAAFGKKIPNQVIVDAYNEFKRAGEKHGGIYYMYTPIWIPVDKTLIKQILYQDYWYFASHGFFYHHKDDVLTNHIFNSEGEEWKRLRNKLSPTFTTGKLKIMFDILDSIGDRLIRKVDNLYKQNEPLNIKEVAACFGTDVIASCAFGIESNTLEEPYTAFRKYGKMIFEPRYFWELVEMFFNWDFLNFFGYTWMPKDVNKFFLNLVKDMVEYREKNNITRNDFLHLLLQLKNKGNLLDKNDITKNTDAEGVFSLDDITANVFVMYAAGFETTSTTISFLMYELARNPDIQEKARAEIRNLCKNRTNNQLTYEDLHEMKYCDMLISETLRIHTVATEVPRKCTTTYTIPGTDTIIEKGTDVLIPSWGIHNDTEYYPNPRVFNPENFSDESKAKRLDFVYFPFGEGPRLCIGYRFAIIQIKVAIFKYLMQYKYTLNPSTPKNIEYEANTVTMVPKGNVLLDITPII